MARPDKMPQRSVIDGFKGLVDFYYWKGVVVARAWPRYKTRTPSLAEAANQTDFAYINRLYGTLPAIVLQGLIEHARGTTQTPKDYLVRAYLKGLFEIMPPELTYLDRWAQKLIHTKIGPGDYNMLFTAVPPGQVWILQTFSWTNRARIVRAVEYLVAPGGHEVVLLDRSNPAAYQYSIHKGENLLEATDFPRVYFVGCQNNDILEATVWGYKFTV